MKDKALIDHVVLLVSEDDFNNPPAWITDNFLVFEGGNHTGTINEWNSASIND
jgi:hypothetical protein